VSSTVWPTVAFTVLPFASSWTTTVPALCPPEEEVEDAHPAASSAHDAARAANRTPAPKRTPANDDDIGPPALWPLDATWTAVVAARFPFRAAFPADRQGELQRYTCSGRPAPP